jgi:hypothetical protein
MMVVVGRKTGSATMETRLLRFNGAVERDPAIDTWLNKHSGKLGAIARRWFEVMRSSGDEVRRSCTTAARTSALRCPFAYVNMFDL